MPNTVTIAVPNFKKWQKNTEHRRDWIALDRHFFDDPKVKTAKRDCLDAVFCYQWILMNLDAETCKLEMKLSHIKREFMQLLDQTSNRFDVLKRLQCLSNAGLIEFQLVSNELLNEFQLNPKGVLEQPQTLAPVISNKQDITNKQETCSSPLPPSKQPFTKGKMFFQIKRNGIQTTENDWILQCLHQSEKRANTGLNLDDFLEFYPNNQKTFNRWMAHEISVRMSAYAVVMKKTNAKNELTYALSLADKSVYDLNVLSDYLDFFRKNVANNDLEVEFDG